MANQRGFANIVMAISSLVVAVCAVAVTIYVLGTGRVTVEQHRVLDQTALERQVSDAVHKESSVGSEQVSSLACPLAVVADPHSEFSCRFRIGFNDHTVTVTVMDAQGTISVGEIQ